MGAKWIKTSPGLTWQMAQLSELHNQLPCVFHMVIWDAGEQRQAASAAVRSSEGQTREDYILIFCGK